MVSIFSFLSCAGGSTGSYGACVSFIAVFTARGGPAFWWTGAGPICQPRSGLRVFPRPGSYAPSRALMGPRAKYTRKPAVTTHISGCTFRIFPEQALMTAQEMNPTPMPLAME